MSIRELLTDEFLEVLRNRAAEYDRTNKFFAQDFEDLQANGYFRGLLPKAMGGFDWTLEKAIQAQIRLAGAAPATALAVNMHQVWMGVAQVLSAYNDDSLSFLHHRAASGDILGFGISEPGNDLMLFGSRSTAEPQADGGYRFTGRKIFTSLSPGWTMLGTMGLDTSSADSPKLVYGFIDRAEPGITVLDDWDTIGMRASQSCTTLLDGVYAAPNRVVRRLDPGPNNDPMIFGIFACFELLLSAVYTGIAHRALELAIAAAKQRTSMRSGSSLAQDPDIRWRISDAAIALDAIEPQLFALAHDVTSKVDHGPLWYPKLSAMKVRATETAKLVVDHAIRVSGGSAYFNKSEIGRLWRDVQAGAFHPSTTESAHTSMANAWLGPVAN